MSVQRIPVATVTPLPLPSISPQVARLNARSAAVFDLELERARRTPPAEVLAAIAYAARVCDELDAAGMEVRFDLSAGLSAELCDDTGEVVRPLSLHEVMDPSSLLPPDAA